MASVQEILDKVKALKILPIEEIKQILSDNYAEIWETKGEAIGSDWKGNDLVKTGTLRSEMISTTRMISTGFAVISTVPAKYKKVNERYPFVGLTENSYRRLDALWGRE